MKMVFVKILKENNFVEMTNSKSITKIWLVKDKKLNC